MSTWAKKVRSCPLVLDPAFLTEILRQESSSSSYRPILYCFRGWGGWVRMLISLLLHLYSQIILAWLLTHVLLYLNPLHLFFALYRAPSPQVFRTYRPKYRFFLADGNSSRWAAWPSPSHPFLRAQQQWSWYNHQWAERAGGPLFQAPRLIPEMGLETEAHNHASSGHDRAQVGTYKSKYRFFVAEGDSSLRATRPSSHPSTLRTQQQWHWWNYQWAERAGGPRYQAPILFSEMGLGTKPHNDAPRHKYRTQVRGCKSKYGFFVANGDSALGVTRGHPTRPNWRP